MKKSLEKIISQVVKTEAQPEALNIVKKCNKRYVDEVFSYYKKKKLTLICLVIDCAKRQLVYDKKMKLNKKDHFGHLFTLEKKVWKKKK